MAAPVSLPVTPDRMAGLALLRRSRVDAADSRLADLLRTATTGLGSEGRRPPVALVAVGGYGRRELSAFSDLDVMLLHDGGLDPTRLATVADGIWYPLWDSGVDLDHSVRTVGEAREAAAGDLRAALSLLDARHVAGDSSLTIRLRSTLLTDWRTSARTRLPQLADARRDRIERMGELAHSAEPNIKESYGGLRDAVVLRALVASWLVDIPHPQVEAVRGQLLAVRDVLHEVAGRATDTLVAEVADDVATGLGLSDRDVLLRRLYALGRRLAHISEVSRRQAERVANRPRRPVPTGRVRTGPRPVPLTDVGGHGTSGGLAEYEGELTLTADARPEHDAVLPLRAAATAADRGLGLPPALATALARRCPELPTPWPGEARRLWGALLGSGVALVEVWEALDQSGLIDRLLPQWADVRYRPPRNPLHRFTVDRHLVATCVEAAAALRTVRRPDLLLAACLLHDLGKGHAGDHSEVGAELAAPIAAAWGFDATDVATVILLVRHHLLLAEVATGRDLDDPATIDAVAQTCTDVDTLDLLEALTVADSRATGPATATPWRLRLIAELARRVRAQLSGASLWEPYQMLTVPGLDDVAGVGPVGVEVIADDGDEVTLLVAVPDRTGAVAVVAGVLAVERLTVRSATMASVPDDAGPVGVSRWVVSGSRPEPVRLRERIAVGLRDDSDLRRRLAARDASGVRSPRAPAQVRTVPGVTDAATVLEVRAHDRPGLVYAVCAAIAAAGGDIRSAFVSTLGGEGVDAFYVTGPDGLPLGSAEGDVLVKEVAAAVGSPGPASEPG